MPKVGDLLNPGNSGIIRINDDLVSRIRSIVHRHWVHLKDKEDEEDSLPDSIDLGVRLEPDLPRVTVHRLPIHRLSSPDSSVSWPQFNRLVGNEINDLIPIDWSQSPWKGYMVVFDTYGPYLRINHPNSHELLLAMGPNSGASGA